jgi:hypothetical protein
MFTIFFSIAKLFLSIFAFAHRHATHSFVLLIGFSHFFPHVLILANTGGGVTECHLFDIPKVLLSFHIFYKSNMLEISVYSIIDSNVFSVEIGENFLLAL